MTGSLKEHGKYRGSVLRQGSVAFIFGYDFVVLGNDIFSVVLGGLAGRISVQCGEGGEGLVGGGVWGGAICLLICLWGALLMMFDRS